MRVTASPTTRTPAQPSDRASNVVAKKPLSNAVGFTDDADGKHTLRRDNCHCAVAGAPVHFNAGFVHDLNRERPGRLAD